MVKKLILVGSGPFEEAYAPQITETRMSRMSDEERAPVPGPDRRPSKARSGTKPRSFHLRRRCCRRLTATTSCPPTTKATGCEFQENVYQNAWTEALQLRRRRRAGGAGEAGPVPCRGHPWRPRPPPGGGRGEAAAGCGRRLPLRPAGEVRARALERTGGERPVLRNFNKRAALIELTGYPMTGKTFEATMIKDDDSGGAGIKSRSTYRKPSVRRAACR